MGLEVLTEVPGQTPCTVDDDKAIMGRWLQESRQDWSGEYT